MEEKLNERIDPALEERLRSLIDERIDAKLASIGEKQPTRKKKLAVIVSKGTLEAAYPPLILATTAIALDMEAALFFTFFGLHILKKGAAESLRFVPLGNPATPMPMPNIISALPGMTALATLMMKQTIANNGVASIETLRDVCVESGVKIIACQMTVDLFGFEHSDFIDGIDYVGAATFFEHAGESDIVLYT